MNSFDINQVAKSTGIKASTLRIWELRYGWPKPKRKTNGYRVYNAADIKDIQWAASCIAQGKSIRDLIDDDSQLIKPKAAMRMTPSHSVDFSDIPLPKTDDGRRIREQCEEALRMKDHGKITFLQSLAVRLHPVEREVAIEALLNKVKL